MSTLRITTDGDPYPAKAGIGSTSGVPVNNGEARNFSNQNAIKDQVDENGAPKVYNIAYRGGGGGSLRDGVIIAESPNKQEIANNEMVGIALNGVAIYSPCVSQITTDIVSGDTESFAGFNYNLPELQASISGFDACGGSVDDENGEYRYRSGRFLENGFANNERFSDASKYYASNPFGGSDFTRTGNDPDDATVTPGHSKIVGWALDGFPIYGPFAYSNPVDPTSDIVIMRTGYEVLESRIVSPTAPDITTYPLGTFKEDWVYNNQKANRTLDLYNGRFCVTPEFKDGTYAYFLTFSDGSTNPSSLSSPRTPEYPYIIGRSTRQQRTR
jgi:hypothetical protein